MIENARKSVVYVINPMLSLQLRKERVDPKRCSDLEAFSHKPTDGSFGPLPFQASPNANCLNLRAKDLSLETLEFGSLSTSAVLPYLGAFGRRGGRQQA